MQCHVEVFQIGTDLDDDPQQLLHLVARRQQLVELLVHSAYQAALAQLGERGFFRVTLHAGKIAVQRDGGHHNTRLYYEPSSRPAGRPPVDIIGRRYSGTSTLPVVTQRPCMPTAARSRTISSMTHLGDRRQRVAATGVDVDRARLPGDRANAVRQRDCAGRADLRRRSATGLGSRCRSRAVSTSPPRRRRAVRPFGRPAVVEAVSASTQAAGVVVGRSSTRRATTVRIHRGTGMRSVGDQDPRRRPGSRRTSRPRFRRPAATHLRGGRQLHGAGRAVLLRIDGNRARGRSRLRPGADRTHRRRWPPLPGRRRQRRRIRGAGCTRPPGSRAE